MSFTRLGVVLPLGASGAADDSQARFPSVTARDGLIYAYYYAHDGATARSALAISEDGIYFTKLGVVLPVGTTGQADVSHAQMAGVCQLGGLTYLYYTGTSPSGSRVCVAISEDGIHFTKMGVVLPLGSTGQVDVTHTHYPEAVVRDGLIHLYYGAISGSTVRCALAISEDGIHFTKLGVVLPVGTTGQADVSHAQMAGVCQLGGLTYLYYAGTSPSGTRVCVAISEDGIHFTKLGVVLPVGAGGDADDVYVQSGSVVVRDGLTYLYYGGYDGSSPRALLAISESGL